MRHSAMSIIIITSNFIDAHQIDSVPTNRLITYNLFLCDFLFLISFTKFPAFSGRVWWIFKK